MYFVIGYEGPNSPDHPLVWGAAAVEHAGKIKNSVFPKHYSTLPEEWKELCENGSASEMQCRIQISEEDSKEPIYVVDLDLSLLDCKPYKIKEEQMDFMRLFPGIIGIGRGKTRGYYLFKSHEAVMKWFYTMNAGKYKLVPA